MILSELALGPQKTEGYLESNIFVDKLTRELDLSWSYGWQQVYNRVKSLQMQTKRQLPVVFSWYMNHKGKVVGSAPKVAQEREDRKRSKVVAKRSYVLNLTSEEAKALRLLLKKVRSDFLWRKHARRWMAGPEGSVLKKINKLLGKKF